VQRREDRDTRDEVAGQQDRRRTRPLPACDDLGSDVHEATRNAQVRHPVLLREAQPGQSAVPQRRDHRRVGAVGRKSEIAALHVDGDGVRCAELISHPLGAVEVPGRDRQRQRRVPLPQEAGGTCARLARAAQYQYRLALFHRGPSPIWLHFVTYTL
jgi:hypothetical protein